jgi:UDP-N-acetylmuramate dehydrogenase
MDTLTILSNQSLAPHTTIGIGGTASHFINVHSVDELVQALDWAGSGNMPVLVLGGGSNLLISDSGWPGAVIKVRIMGIEDCPSRDGKTRVTCGAGEAWDDLVKHSVGAGLQGIECLSGIPGTVGASPIQNIGAYGQEVKETIAWVEAVDRMTGKLHKFANGECEFDYRWSRFKGKDRDRYVVTAVAFDLNTNGSTQVRYGDLTRYFDERKIETPSLSDVREAVIAVRRSKGMVVDPEIADSRSCGSFFMNPVVPIEQAAQVRNLAELREGEKFPEFPAGEGTVKLSAAWLMERAGLKRGAIYGNVGLSSRHVLAVINRGGGTSAEIESLVRHVQLAVQSKFGIELHPEPVFAGFHVPTAEGLKA